jgi:hypothetical protein
LTAEQRRDPEAAGDELTRKLDVFELAFRVPRNVLQREDLVDQLARAPARRKIDEHLLAQFRQSDFSPPSEPVFRRHRDHHRTSKKQVQQKA